MKYYAELQMLRAFSKKKKSGYHSFYSTYANTEASSLITCKSFRLDLLNY